MSRGVPRRRARHEPMSDHGGRSRRARAARSPPARAAFEGPAHAGDVASAAAAADSRHKPVADHRDAADMISRPYPSKAFLALCLEGARDTMADRVAGLTDGEYFWQPVPNCWSVRRRSESALAAD